MNSIYTKYIFDLPIIPQVVSEILKIPSRSNISSKEVEDIIKIDPYLTSRVLKIANSSYYSRERKIKSIKDAITLIGINKIKAICLLIAGSEIIQNKNEPFFLTFWNESIKTAFIAKSLANETGKVSIEDDIFTAGILHNIGQAILFNFSNEKYGRVLANSKESKDDISVFEKEEFGVDNHEVAAGVLGSWEFPDLHIDVVKNYLNSTAHSNFQGVIDVISISKLILKQIEHKTLDICDKDKLLAYQSRLNLRYQQLEYYSNEFLHKLQNNNFFTMCKDAISN